MGIFKGSGVALATPFNEDMSINYIKLEELIEWHIEKKTDALIIAGTTGESSTLPDEEHIELIKRSVEIVGGRIPVIAGSGSNDTRHGIKLSIECEKVGVDGLLIVTPYYNKTNRQGLINHYTSIADQVNIPIILYNVPGRTGMDIPADVVKELSNHKNIVGLKEASGDISY
ncbi:4-hydroxy-tetrahydrodipicolinate synthase, partial [Psychrilyobacter sp.]|uniref:4-hydroxy-tetrahydrodipicolinate synthase n=1 Tax=Psychrilyobacter sp. TaxID=2586924 RepID=UPI0030197388